MKNFRKDLVEKYKNPAFRKLALCREAAVNRKPALDRKSVGFPDDSKLRVVLDTNIFINATKKEVDRAQKSCMEIIKLWEADFFELGIQHILFEEYKMTGESQARKGLIYTDIFNNLMKKVYQKAFFHRVLVSKQHYAHSYKDDHLFDGLSADYLVSEDRKDIVLSKVITAQTNYKYIVTADGFLDQIRN